MPSYQYITRNELIHWNDIRSVRGSQLGPMSNYSVNRAGLVFNPEKVYCAAQRTSARRAIITRICSNPAWKNWVLSFVSLVFYSFVNCFFFCTPIDPVWFDGSMISRRIQITTAIYRFSSWTHASKCRHSLPNSQKTIALSRLSNVAATR